ncbi:hypothetical protein ACP0BX_000571 [Amphidinium carterae]
MPTSMRSFASLFVLFALGAADMCELMTGTETMMEPLSAYTNMKIKFVGFKASVTRVRAGGTPMLQVTGYSHMPIMTTVDGQLVVSVDESTCMMTQSSSTTATTDNMTDDDEDEDDMTNTTTMDGGSSDDAAGASKLSSSAALLGAMAVAAHHESPLAATCLGASALAVGALGDSHACIPTINVVIHAPVDPSAIDAQIAAATKTGQYRDCAAETLYYEHDASVYGGYAGCTGEMGFLPCEQESHEGWQGMTDYNKPMLWDENTMSCVQTANTLHNTTLWILWGYPMDTHELVKRTGLNPVIKFPLMRATYPSYPADSHGNDAISFIPKVKEWLVYLGGFTAAELVDQGVELTEGAEAGMVELFGAMAAHIAKSTCNRQIYVLMEAPAYGYDTTRAAQLANNMRGSFYNDASCPCYAEGTCNDATVTISPRGWFPATPFPTEADAFGNMHAADSSSGNSPWFESMVFPENPTGVRKTPQLSVDRRVCDGVYLYPMYFGANDWAIPQGMRPDCAGWSFSITKFYSATVRAGFLIYDTTLPETWTSSVVSIINEVHGIADGIYSEWSWMGQEQIFAMVMAKPISDETSWMGAYSLLQKEKWDYVINGFANCPVVEITNPYAGAYVFFKFKSPYLGLQTSSTPSFFLQCLGLRATTYSWGFRGADPADYYGAGYGTNDFTRMQLYRDVSVYEEVGRRAAIVCGGGSVPPFLTISEWEAANTFDRRLGASGDHEERLREAAPRLSGKEVQHLANLKKDADAMDARMDASCAPSYTTDCLFKHMGKKVEDVAFL